MWSNFGNFYKLEICSVPQMPHPVLPVNVRRRSFNATNWRLDNSICTSMPLHTPPHQCHKYPLFFSNNAFCEVKSLKAKSSKSCGEHIMTVSKSNTIINKLNRHFRARTILFDHSKVRSDFWFFLKLIVFGLSSALFFPNKMTACKDVTFF